MEVLMKKSNKTLKRLLFACVIVLFIILSGVKFYTMQVSFSNDPTVAIVKTEDIQWSNNMYKIDKETLPYNWYEDYGFKILYADEMGHTWQTLHSFAIIAWWIILFYLLATSIKSLFKIIYKTGE
jgi:hypothetical protein